MKLPAATTWLPELKSLVQTALELEQIDCGDSSCAFAATKTGMRTNGGCRCMDKGELSPELRMVLRRLAYAVRKLPPGARLFIEEI